MRWVRIFIVAVLVVLMETTVLRLVELQGVRPDLAFIFVFFLALNSDPDEGFPAFWAVGFIKDFFSAGPPGAYALLYSICGYGVGGLTQRLFKEDPFVQAMVAFPAVMLLNVLYLAALIFMYPDLSLLNFAKYALLCSMYTTALVPPLVFLMSKVKFALGIRPPSPFPPPQAEETAH